MYLKISFWSNSNFFLKVIILTILILNPFFVIAKEIKYRLPETINRYQPVIVPVIHPQHTILFLDRQNYPENTGGIRDHDDIWYSKWINNEWTELSNLSSINTEFSDVLFSITPDGNNALIYHNFGDTTLTGQFYLYTLNNNYFNKIAPLNIKNFYNRSPNFYGHLSYDKNKLLLSLDREDTFGGLDLYISFFDSSMNEWSEPLNLGNIINTSGIETSPFLGYDGSTLYFASNGHSGFGKLDLYMSRRLDDSWQNWTKPQNFGSFINTHQDDHCLYLTVLADTAYIVSYDSINARNGIYYVIVPNSLKPDPYVFIEGEIKRNNPKTEPVTIEIIDLKGDIINLFVTHFINYAIILPVNNDYTIKFSANDYLDTIIKVNLFNVDMHQRFRKDINLKKKSQNSYVKKVIYFGFDEDRVEISNELADELINLVKLNNIRELLLVGHTDKIGSDKYNRQLSRKRAENTKKYLQKILGADINIKTQWKGSREPISEQDTENRRVEIYLPF